MLFSVFMPARYDDWLSFSGTLGEWIAKQEEFGRRFVPRDRLAFENGSYRLKFRYAHPPIDSSEVVAIQDNYLARPLSTVQPSNCRHELLPKKSLESGEPESFLHAVIAATLIVRISGKNNVATAKTHGMRGRGSS
jgi:hypothetical protein